MKKRLLLSFAITLIFSLNLLAQTPSITNGTPSENFINESFCFPAVLTNSGGPGYNPIVHAVFPPGIEFQGLSFMGGGIGSGSLQEYIVGGAGQVTDLILEARIERDGGDPNDAIIIAPTGSTVVIAQLPVGSVVQGGVDLELEFCAKINDPSDAFPATVGTPLPISITPLYELGSDPEGNGILFGSTNTRSVIPKLYELSKSNSAPRGENPPGDTWMLDYTISVDIADGQTITDMVLADVLPNGLKLDPNSVVITGGLSVDYNPTTMNLALDATPVNGTDGGTLEIECASVGCGVSGGTGGGDLTIQYRAYIVDILNQGFCEEDVLTNQVSLTSGTYNGATISPATQTASSSVTARHLTVQHGNPVKQAGAPGSNNGFQPGDIVDFTIQYQINEFPNSEIDRLEIELVVPDGMTFQGLASFPTIAGVTLNNITTPAFAKDPTTGQTVIVWDIYDAYINHPSFMTAPTTIPDGGRAGTLVYTVEIDQAFSAAAKSGIVIVENETLTPEANIVYDMDEGASNCSNSDTAPISISPVTINKTLLNPNPTGVPYVPGDMVEYQLDMTILSGDARNIIFEEFLPLPVFDVTDYNVYAGGTTIGVAGSTDPLRYSADDESVAAGLTIDDIEIDAPKNLLRILFDDLAFDPGSGTNQAVKISIIVVGTITSRPFDDGLFHTNFLQGETAQTGEQADADVLILVGSPKLTITKGIEAVDHTQADDNIDPPLSALEFPLDGNVTGGADAGDQVTYHITIVNEGSAPAQQLLIKDIEAASNLTNFNVLSIRDGTGVDRFSEFRLANDATNTPLANAAAANATLFSGTGIEMLNGFSLAGQPTAGTNFSSKDDGGANVLHIIYTADIIGTIEPSTIRNNASVQWKNRHDTDPSNFYKPDTDDATITIEPQIEKIRSDIFTDVTKATVFDTDIAQIGNVVAYTVDFIVPEGETPSSVLVDQMHPNLSYVAGTIQLVGSVPAGVTWANGGTTLPTPTVSDNGSGEDNLLTLNLGTISNTNTDNIERRIRITYDAIVVEKIDATTVTNDANWNFIGGSVDDSAPDVTLVRPNLEITKRVRIKGSGDPFTDFVDDANKSEFLEFEITIENLATESSSFAYDLTITDIYDPNDLSDSDFSVTSIENGSGTDLMSLISTSMPTSGEFEIALTDYFTDGSAPCGTPGGAGCAGVAPTSVPASGNETIVIILETRILTTVQLDQTFQNTARVQYYLKNGCPAPDCIELEDSDDVDVRVEGITTFEKNIASITDGYTGTNNVNPLTIINYELRFTIPEGVAPDAVIYDTLDVGLTYSGTSAITPTTLSTGVTFTGGAGVANEVDVTTTLLGDGRTLISFDFGDVANADIDPLVTEEVAIQYPVQVDDGVAENTVLRNLAELTYDNATPPPAKTSIPTSNTPPEITVIRPQLEVEKIITNSNNPNFNPITDLDATGNLDNADGSDQVTFQITIRNTDTQSRAYDLVISDLIPNSLTNPQVIGMKLTDGTDTNVTDLVVNPSSPMTTADYTSFFNTADVNNMFSTLLAPSSLNSVSSNLVFLEPDGGLNQNELVITYTAEISPNAVQPLDITNEVEVTFTTRPSATPETPIMDDATISGFLPRTFTKELVSITSADVGGGSLPGSAAGGGSVQIGEVLLYRVTMEIPEGTMNSWFLRDNIDQESDGAIFLEIKSITLENVSNPANITSTVGSLTAVTPIVSNSGGGDQQRRDRLNFDFGIVTNSENDSDRELIVIDYYVTVGNHSSVRNGTDIGNLAQFNYLDAGGTRRFGPGQRADEVLVVEPRVNITKQFLVTGAVNAGTTVDVQIELEVDRGVAFDIDLDDIFPAGLTYSGSVNPTITGSFSAATMATFTGVADGAGSIGVDITRLADGENIIFTFPVTIDGNVVCGGLDNTANVEWHSLANDFSDLLAALSIPTTPINPSYPACTGERRGSGSGCSNTYSASSMATVNVNPDPAIDLTITNTPALPICSTAVSTSSVTLEITEVVGATYQWQREDTANPGVFIDVDITNTPGVSGETSFELVVPASADNRTRYRIQVSRGGCSNLTSAPFLLDIIPTPSVDIVDNLTAPNCTGGVNLTANVTNLDASETYQYIWTFPNPAGGADLMETTNTPELIRSDAISGNYSVQVNILRGSPAAVVCSNTRTETIMVNTVETPILNGGIALLEPCSNDGVITLSPTTPASYPAGSTFTWRRNTIDITGIPNNSTLVIDPSDLNAPGNYSLVVTSADGCVSSPSAEIEVRVTASPTTPILTAPGVCAGEDLVLGVDASITYPANATYSWVGPNGFTANTRTATIPSATLAADGLYTLTVSVPTSSSSCTASETIRANVTTKPTLTGITGDLNLCDGSTLDLTADVIAGGIYVWTQPDGSIATTNTARLTKTITDNAAADEGTYSVLVIVNGCASDPIATNVVISPAPGAPGITPAAGGLCEGETLILNTTAIADSYRWIFPDGSISNVQSPTVTTDFQAANVGTYTLETTTGSCTVSSSVTYTLNPTPTTPVLTITDSDICRGEGITLSATAGFDEYIWISPTGNTFTTNAGTTTALFPDPHNPPPVTTAETGLYASGEWKVRVRNTTTTCVSEDSDPITVTITNLPVANPSVVGSTTICPGSSVVLTADDITGATYEWYKEDNSTPGLQIGGDLKIAVTREHTDTNVLTDATYYVVVTVNGCENATPETASITVDNSSVPDLTSITDVTVCEGEILTFTGVSGGVTYEWSGPGGFSSTEPNPLVTNSTSIIPHQGLYSVKVFSSCGFAEKDFNVTVNTKPNQPVISASPSTVCENSTFDLTSSIMAGANEVYRWIAPTGIEYTTGGAAMNQTITVAGTIANAGDWRVQIVNTSTNCESEASDPVTITVNPLPTSIPTTSTPTICVGDEIILIGNEVTGATYRWYVDDNDNNTYDNASATNPDDLVGTSRIVTIPNASASERYYLEVILNGCSSSPIEEVDVTVNPKPVIADIETSIELNCTVGNTDIKLNQMLGDPTSNFSIEDDAGNTLTGTFNYVWTGPNGYSSISTDPDFAVIPTANSGDQGTYIVYVEDANGCRSNEVAVVVDITDAIETPVINFAGRLCEGEEMELRVESPYSGTSVSYQWFRNGAPLTTTTIPSYIVPTVVAATDEGLYSVQVSVTNGDPTNADPAIAAQAYTCTSLISAQTNVEIVENPDLSNALTVTYNTATAFDCPGGTIQLTNPATNSTSATHTYLWIGPNGYTSTERNPQIINAGLEYNGTYELTVTNGGLCSVTRSVDMNLIKPQPVTPTITGPTQVCVGDNVILSVPAYTGAMVSYEWIVPTGPNRVTTVPQLTITGAANPTDAGNYQVEVTVDGCTSLLSAPLNLEVEPKPTTPAINTTAATVCEGGTINLTTTTTADKYIWTGPNGFVFETTVNSSVVVPNVTTANGGTYSLQIENKGCRSDAATQAITVNSSPDKPSLGVNKLALCSDENLVLTSSTLVGADKYIFIKPNGGTIEQLSTATDPHILTITASTIGTGNFLPGEWRVQIEDGNGCVSPVSDAIDVVINQKPSALALNDGPICLGNGANLLGNPIDGATYEWFEDTDNSGGLTAGDDLISTGQNHPINSSDLSIPGNYRYFLRVTKDGCVSDVDDTVIEVKDPTTLSYPTIRVNSEPDITGNPSPVTTITVCEGEQIILSSPTASTSYTWSGPDGFSSTLQNPASFFANPASAGEYTLETVDASCPTDLQRFRLVVNETPTKPVISATSLNVCNNESIELSATSITGVGYVWIQPNGLEHPNTGTLTSNTLTIPSMGDAKYLSGEWRVKIVNTTSGCISETSDPITININPLPTAIPASGGNVCSDEDIQLFGNSVTGANYQWYREINGNGTFDDPDLGGVDNLISTNQNPLVSGLTNTGTTSITYTFWLVIEANGCKSAAQSVSVDMSAPLALAATATNELCLDVGDVYDGFSITTPSPIPAGNTFRWEGPNGFVSSAQEPKIPNATAANSGTYTVVMTDPTTGCQSAPVTVEVEIANRPVTPTITVSSTSLCEGAPLTLSTTAYPGAEYRWYRDGVALATGNPTTIPSYSIASSTVTDEGNYSVEIISDPLTASCISSRSGEVNVQVDAIPDAPVLVPAYVDATASGTNCEGGTLTITLETSAGLAYNQPGYTYQWVGPNGFTSTEQAPTVNIATVLSNGTYSVTVSNGTCGSSATASVTVNNILPVPPTPGLSVSPFICTGEIIELRTDAFSSTSVQYTWYFDDDPATPGEVTLGTTTNPSFIVPGTASAANAGLYSVEITAGGCASPRSVAQQVVVNTNPDTPMPAYTYTGNCAGQTLGLTSNVANHSASFTYFWTGPNGFVSTQQNPNIPNATAANNGTYVVTVNNGGCTNTASIIFNDIINITPFSPAIIPPNPVCVGERTVITASNYAGAGSNVTYNWTLPDGSTFTSGSNQLVIDPVTLASAGEYTVQVDVDGCALPTSLPERLRVNSFPSTPTPSSNGPVCEGGTIRLFANGPTSGGPFTYEWTGPRNFFSSLENPTIDLVTPDYEGTYVLTLSGPGGCSVTSTVQVSVGELIAPPTIAGEDRYCIGDRLELTATTYPGDVVYTWTLPDGTNEVTTVGQLVIESVTAANSGDYTVRVKVSDCETGTSFAKQVTVDNVGTVEATSNTGICEGESLQLTATPSNTSTTYTYNWEGPNGFTSTLQNPTINGATNQNSGVYIVSMSTTEGGCTQTAQVNVVIESKPEAPLLISNQSVICEGDPIILSTGSQGATYQWIGPDGTINPNDDILTTTSGTTTIPSTHPSYRSGVWRVKVIGTGGCESDLSQPIEIEIADRPVAIISNNSTICEGEEVEISGNEFTGASYSWYDDNNGARGQLVATGRTLSLGVLPSGSYNYYLIVAVNGCTSEVATAQVNVVGAGLVPTPSAGSASVCGGNDIQLFSNIDADFYTWTGPNGFTSGEQNPIIPNATPSDAGRYALTVTQNNCTSSPGTVVVEVTDGAQAVSINPITAVCEGERLIINSAGLAGSGITYLWIKPDGSQQTTSGPSLIIENAQTTDAGAYYVTVNNNGCISSPSAAVFATVNTKPTLPAISITSQICEGEAIILSTPVNADNYLWTGPNGFTSTLKNPPVIQNANEFNAGEYTLWVETNGCRSEINTAQVTVTEKPIIPQIFSNSPVCNNGILELFTTRINANEQYTWYLPDGTTRITQDTFLVIQPFTNVRVGEYRVSRTLNGCISEPSVALSAQLIENLAEETAYAGEDLFICDLSESITLNASSTQNGVWTALDGGSLATPTRSSTVVSGLRPEGMYRFVWTIDNRPCGDLSSDTVVVQPAGNPVANADFEETQVDGFQFKQILLNDVIPQGNDITVEIIRSPVNGSLTLQPDFTVNYKPVPGYFGEDSFIYEVCLVDCPANCDTAIVDILVTGDLEIPDIITPNGDGNNDTFVIRGIENFPENELLIFNRWGNKVFEAINYENDWRGTWKNNELPDGTYYYVFTNRQSGQLISKGFITLHR